jgi:dephospho-CoA kinase
MKRIGLTGGIASGKSLIVDMLRRQNIPVIDADELSRSVSAKGTPGLAAILRHFGNEYAAPDGSLDRKKLGTLIFADPSARLALEGLTHPLIGKAMADGFDALAQAGHSACVYSAPLIFEKNLEGLFDNVILVWCEEATQMQRLAKRDGISLDDAKLRLAAQMPLAQKKALTPYQIDNNLAPENTAKQLSTVWFRMTSEARTFS